MESLNIYGEQLTSRLMLGTAAYASPTLMSEAVTASGCKVVTLSIRRQSPENMGGSNIWDYIKKLPCRLLPNTAGCHNAKEAIKLALMARDIFATDWIKLEVIGDEYNLQPHPLELVEAAQTLIKEGFKVLPYTTDDLVLCQKLYDMGCQVLMPWGAPIGSGRGLLNPYALETLRKRLPDATLIIDAGIGRPSHASQAMEMGYDGILLNTAVARAVVPVQMAQAFRLAVKAGRLSYLAGIIAPRQAAQATTPTLDEPFWHQRVS